MSDEWAKVRLEDVVDILDAQRRPVSRDERQKRLGKVPYYGATGLAGWIDDYLFDEPLVLLGEDAVDFATPSTTKAYVVRGPSWINNHAHVLRARSDHVETDFLCHALNIVDYTGFASFGTRSKLTQGSMRKIEFRVPPLPVQRRIVDLMTHLDTHIANLQAEQEAGMAAVKALRHKNWSDLEEYLRPLGEVIQGITAGRSPETTGDRPAGDEDGVLKVNSVDPSGVFLADEAKVLRSGHGLAAEWELRGGEVLVTRANTAERVAAVARVPLNVRKGLYLCDKTLRLDFDHEQIEPDFLSEMLQSSQARQQVAVMATGVGSSMVNLSQAKFRSWLVPVPTDKVQREVAGNLLSLRSLRMAIAEEVATLSVIRMRLLEDLLSGAFTVDTNLDAFIEAA